MEITDAVWTALDKLQDEFRCEPYHFFTEHDLATRAYCLIQSELGWPRARLADGGATYLVHHEYPTPFRCEMTGKKFAVRDDQERTKTGGKFQRGHYDLVVFDPEFLAKCSFDLAKGQNYGDLRRALPHILQDLGRPALVTGIEFMYSRDPFPSADNAINWCASVLQDYEKLIASLKWNGLPFIGSVRMLALSCSDAHAQTVRDELAGRPGIVFCMP